MKTWWSVGWVGLWLGCASHHAAAPGEDACADIEGRLAAFDVQGCERWCTVAAGFAPAVTSAWVDQLIHECPPPELAGFTVTSLSNAPSGGLFADGRAVRWSVGLAGPDGETVGMLAIANGELKYARANTSAVPCAAPLQLPDSAVLVPAAVTAFEAAHGPRRWLLQAPPSEAIEASLFFQAWCEHDGNRWADSAVLTLWDDRGFGSEFDRTYLGGVDANWTFTGWCERCEDDFDPSCDCFPAR